MICALLLAISWLGNHPNRSVGANTNAERHSQYTEREGDYPFAPRREIQGPQREPYPERGEWRAESDLIAQWEAARWTFWSAIISGVGALVALVGVVLVARTLDAARQANKGFSDAASRQLRAYVFVENVSASAYATEDRVTFTVKVDLKNCGQTPAKGVFRLIELFPGSGHTLSNPKFQGFSGSREPLDIGPGQSFSHEYQVWSEYTPDQTGIQPGFGVYGRVEYSDFTGDKWTLRYTREFGEFTAPFAPHIMVGRNRFSEAMPGELQQVETQRE